jgi:hypothetical protein
LSQYLIGISVSKTLTFLPANGVAWQNVVYNKPPHPGFYLGDGMKAAPKPSIYLVGEGEAISGMK